MTYKEFKNGNIKLYNGKILIGNIHLVDIDQLGSYILSLYVRDRHQNNGYGRQLLDYAIAKSKLSGCTAISLYVDTKNEGAIRFYKCHGFFIALTTSKKKRVKSHYLMTKQI